MVGLVQVGLTYMECRLLAGFDVQANGDNEGHSGGQVNRQAKGLVNGRSSNSPYRCHLCRGDSREDKDHGAYVHATDWDFSPQVITGYVCAGCCTAGWL